MLSVRMSTAVRPSELCFGDDAVVVVSALLIIALSYPGHVRSRTSDERNAAVKKCR